MQHTIEIEDDTDGERSYWSCGCGAGGSCPSYRVDVVAEAHVPDGVRVVYRQREADPA